LPGGESRPGRKDPEGRKERGNTSSRGKKTTEKSREGRRDMVLPEIILPEEKWEVRAHGKGARGHKSTVGAELAECWRKIVRKHRCRQKTAGLE